MMLRLVVGLVLLLGAVAVRAETVKLKNGTVVNGAIVQMTETDVTIDTADMGQIVVKRRAVDSFTDADPVPGAAVVAAPPTAAAIPGAGISINNNNNNNNNVAATAAAAATAAPVAAPAAPAPPAAPATPPASIAPVVLATPTGDETGMVMGGLSIGAAMHRFADEPVPDDSSGPFKQAQLFVHWDVIGYRAANGLGLTLFGEGTHEAEDRGVPTWVAGGLRGDWSFGRHRTRSGAGSFRMGVGGAYVALRQNSRESMASPTADATSGVAQKEASSPTVIPADATASLGRGYEPSNVRDGKAVVAMLGYQYVGDGGFGIGVDLHAMSARLTESKDGLQTLGATFGLTYAL